MAPAGGAPKTQRFLRSERLRRRSEFLTVQRRGRKIHLRDLLAVVHGQGGSRLGITVTKKVGGAVVRNRIKRLIRESWRRERHLIPSGPDVVIIAKHSAAAASYEELRRQIRDLARRLRRLDFSGVENRGNVDGGQQRREGAGSGQSAAGEGADD